MDVSARGLGKVSVRPGVDLPGTASGATRSQVSVATATGVYVTPGTVKYEPAAAKAWVTFTVTGTTPNVKQSLNVTTVSRTSAGIFRITFTNQLNVNYAVHVGGKLNNSGPGNRWFATPLSSGSSLTSTFVKVNYFTTGLTGVDPLYASVIIFGGLP